MPTQQPTGTVTMLFTDIEGSTRLLERLGPERFRESLELHRRLLRGVFERHRGYEVDHEGDAFFVAFAGAADAVAAAREAQQSLAAADWPEALSIRVRMGIHTGEPLNAPPKYVGLDVHKAARIMAAGHGGQVLLSDATRRLVADVPVVSLGAHRLKDMSQPETLYQLQIDGLPSEFPALKTLGNRPNNLPTQPTALIGRQREVAEVLTMLSDPDARLVTLTGPGGTGKTRLGLQVGAELLDAYSGGVFFVSLAPVRDPHLVIAEIAQALAVRESAGEDIAATLVAYLEQKEMLLVLDNFEHVIEAASDVAALLESCSQLGAVVTSRERLRLRREHVYPVPPLALVDANADPSEIVQNEAVSLFIARAQAATGGFALDDDFVSVAAEICSRLDGLPLAIELAAARVAVFPPRLLLDRIDERLGLLTRGARDADVRQRTLRDSIAWSYDLLTDLEKLVFARLAAFSDSCDAGAAASVCAPDGLSEIDLFDCLESLVDKSLVKTRLGEDGSLRYWLLETIRVYAREQLEAAFDAETTRSRLLSYLSLLLSEGRAALERGSEEVFLRIDGHYNDFRAALRRAISESNADAALMLVAELREYWLVRGHLREGREVANAALSLDGGSDGIRARALEAAAHLAVIGGDAEAAELHAAQADRLARSIGDADVAAAALRMRGHAALLRGDAARAAALYEESASTARSAGNDRLLTYALFNGGNAALLAGDFGRARVLTEDALARYRLLGETISCARASFNLALVNIAERDVEAAEPLLVDALSAAVQLRWTDGIGIPLGVFATIAAAAGEYEQAARLLGASDALLEQAGASRSGYEKGLYDDTTRDVRRRLGPDAFGRAHEDGRARPDEAVAIVVGRTPDAARA